MRSLILSLLLASAAATPALAQERHRDRGEGHARSDPDRTERARPARDDSARPARVERVQRDRGDFAAREERRSERRERREVQVVDGMGTAAPADSGRGRRFDRPFGGGSDGDVRRTRREWAGDRTDVRRRRDGGSVVTTQPGITTEPGVTTSTRSGTSRYAPSSRLGTSRYSGNNRWSGDWRRDRRYDWRSYRDRNRSVFRFGSYYDPYGFGYQRFSIGFSLFPNYYRSNYWLNDPSMYRLPPAYGPYRWVRYWDDALLVDIYSGQVIDVVHNFFW